MRKLGHRERLYLLHVGYNEDEISDIERQNYKYTFNYGREVSEDLAIRRLGNRSWLSGIARACFHRIAVRDCQVGNAIISFERI
jgi:hypothetical protein